MVIIKSPFLAAPPIPTKSPQREGATLPLLFDVGVSLMKNLDLIEIYLPFQY